MNIRLVYTFPACSSLMWSAMFLCHQLKPDGEFLLLEEHQVHCWLPVAAEPDEDSRLRDGGSAVQHRWSLV